MNYKRLISVISLILALSMIFCSCKTDNGKVDNTGDDVKYYDQQAAFSANYSLDCSEMTYLFYGTINDFYSAYANYMSYIGLDLEKSLKTQQCSFEEDVNQTWFDYFLVSTKLYAEQFIVLSEVASSEGISLTDEEKAEIDEGINQIKDYCKSNNITIDEYFDNYYGNGVDEESVRHVMDICFKASSYYNKIYNGYTFTDEEITNYINENLADEEDYKYVNVRHILVKTEDEAKELLNEILKEEDVEKAFSLAAAENTLDGGSKNTGGLYENIYKGQMVETFENWCFDKSRKVGDTGIVESTHGFHIMYFSSFSDKTYFNETADLGLRNAKFNKQYDEWCKLYPVTFNDEVLQKIDA